jgi:hypothetical protein
MLLSLTNGKSVQILLRPEHVSAVVIGEEDRGPDKYHDVLLRGGQVYRIDGPSARTLMTAMRKPA